MVMVRVTLFQVVTVVTSASVLQGVMGGSDYENCSKKLRQLILDSCGEPKGKRSAILADYSLHLHPPHKATRHNVTPTLLGTSIFVPRFRVLDMDVLKKVCSLSLNLSGLSS
jgi:hypothetical protein